MTAKVESWKIGWPTAMVLSSAMVVDGDSGCWRRDVRTLLWLWLYSSNLANTYGDGPGIGGPWRVLQASASRHKRSPQTRDTTSGTATLRHLHRCNSGSLRHHRNRNQTQTHSSLAEREAYKPCSTPRFAIVCSPQISLFLDELGSSGFNYRRSRPNLWRITSARSPDHRRGASSSALPHTPPP
jgi:hypothetical protein